ncbi:hypothetical protein T10_10251 [Trichinella papuae]|uniref:Uncharacterized protein n=1 Tax=Trichinella papuae TaxID=268474 RepID=A0A0V1LX14_9BILA|nr:hypothetical protein T10_10251 [Trichinella papuae]
MEMVNQQRGLKQDKGQSISVLSATLYKQHNKVEEQAWNDILIGREFWY